MPSKTKMFQSAFPRTGPAPTPAQILAFHRSHFGGLRMEEGAPAAPAPAAPADPAPVPAPPPAAPAATGKPNGPDGYPLDTPQTEMTQEQQLAYWKTFARRHESRSRDYDAVVAERDRLKTAGMTDSERAVEQARTEARQAAERETSGKYQARLVTAEVKAALAGVQLPADRINAQVEFLDHSKFLTPEGEVDADKVKQYAAGLAPAGGQWPDMGGGARGGATKTKGVSAGADMFAASRGKKTD